MSTTAVLLPKPGGGGAWQKIDGKWQSGSVSEKNDNLKPKLGDIKTERNLDIQVGLRTKSCKILTVFRVSMENFPNLNKKYFEDYGQQAYNKSGQS